MVYEPPKCATCGHPKAEHHSMGDQRWCVGTAWDLPCNCELYLPNRTAASTERPSAHQS